MNNNNKYTILSLFLMMLIPCLASSQVSDKVKVEEAVRLYVEENDITTLLHFYKETQTHELLLQITQPYLLDQRSATRDNAYSIILNVSLKSDNLAIQQKGALLLLSALRDEDRAIRNHYSRRLRKLNSIHFSEQFIQETQELLQIPDLLTAEIILLAGIFNLASNKPLLIDLANQRENDTKPFFFGSLNWAANLALARMNEASYTEYVVQKINKIHTLNIVIHFLDELLYTRQDLALQEVINYALSQERLPALDNGMRERFANRAIWHLAKVVENFPLPATREKSFSKEEIKLAQQWLTTNNGKIIMQEKSF